MELIDISEEILARAIYLYGHNNQMEKLKEACLDLTVALQKHHNGRGNSDDTFNNVLDEVANVTILLKQAHMMLPIKLINDRIEFKMANLETKINEITKLRE